MNRGSFLYVYLYIPLPPLGREGCSHVNPDPGGRGGQVVVLEVVMGKFVLVGFVALCFAGLVLLAPVAALISTMLSELAKAGI